MEFKPVYGPQTRGYDTFERVWAKNIFGAFERYETTGKPVSLLYHTRTNYKDVAHREHLLSKSENEIVELAVLEACGVSDDFANRIIAFSSYDEECGIERTGSPTEGMFENCSDIYAALSFLEDNASHNPLDPGQTTVGFAIDTEKGLVVVKQLATPLIASCPDCKPNTPDKDGVSFGEDQSCEHEFGRYEYALQISLWPKDQLKNIDWYVNTFSTQP